MINDASNIHHDQKGYNNNTEKKQQTATATHVDRISNHARMNSRMPVN